MIPTFLSLMMGSLTFHQYPGCPDNSQCSRIAGEKRNKWIFFLKTLPDNSSKVKKMEKFRRNHGIPLDFWTRDGQKGDDIIRYDSSCTYQTKKIYLAQVIGKNFKHLMNNKQHFLNTAFVVTAKDIQHFIIPRSSLPLYTTTNGPVFSIEEDGFYYHLKAKKNGMIQIVHRKESRRSKKQDCPKKLIDHLKKNHSGFYKKWFCRSLWNIDQSQYQTMLFTWSCP